jgi:hypothetical protein
VLGPPTSRSGKRHRSRMSNSTKRPSTEAAYPTFATTLSECWHIGHSKVRTSCPGLSGTTRASSICEPHFGHPGRIVPGCKRVMAHAPNIRREHYRTLSHRRLRDRPSAGDGAQCALTEQIANHKSGRSGFQNRAASTQTEADQRKDPAAACGLDGVFPAERSLRCMDDC